MAYATTKESAYELIERMAPAQLEVVVPLLARIVDPVSPLTIGVPWEDEEISAEENEAVARAKAESGPGTSLEEFMAELGDYTGRSGCSVEPERNVDGFDISSSIF